MDHSTSCTGRSSRCRRRSRRGRSRGFALFVVVLMLALLTAAVSVTLDESVSNLRAQSLSRSREMARSGIEHGLHFGIRQVQQSDAWVLEDPANDWDIFEAPRPTGTEFVGPLPYPTAGALASQFLVRVGLRPSQRTRAPAGEDVRAAYGQVVELQVAVEPNQPGMPQTEDRVSVGILVPRLSSHAP